MSKHVRNLPPVRFDVTNEARCTAHGDKRICVANCPRHNAITYSEQYARHATDSIGQVQ